ncbi:unnamed protein product [Urochloa humidicola]
MPRRRRRRGDLAVAAALATVLLAAVGVAGGDGGAEFDYRKLSGIIIPGFASTQLRAWSVLDCPYSPFDFNPPSFSLRLTAGLNACCLNLIIRQTIRNASRGLIVVFLQLQSWTLVI